MDNLKCERCNFVNASFKCLKCNNSNYCTNCSQHIHDSLIYKSHNPHPINLQVRTEQSENLNSDSDPSSRSLKKLLQYRKEKLQNKPESESKVALTEINDLYLKQKESFNKETSSLKDQLTKLNNELSSNIDNIKFNINQTFTDNSHYLKTVESNLDNRLMTIKQSQDEEVTEFNNELNKLKAENLQLRESIKQSEKEILFLRSINSQLENQVNIIKRSLDEQKINLCYSYDYKINLIYEEIDKEKKEWKEQLDEMKLSYDNKVLDLKIQMEKLNKNNKELNEIISSSINIKEFNSVKQELSKVKSEYLNIQGSFNDLIVEADAAKKRLQSLVSENFILNQKVKSNALEIESYKNEVELMRMKQMSNKHMNLIKLK